MFFLDQLINGLSLGALGGFNRSMQHRPVGATVVVR